MLQDEVPSYDEGPELADGDVGVDVRAARLRYPGGQLGVTEGRQNGSETSHEEAEDHPGSSRVVRDRSRQHVNSGADHMTHAWKPDYKCKTVINTVDSKSRQSRSVIPRGAALLLFILIVRVMQRWATWHISVKAIILDHYAYRHRDNARV